MYGSVHGGSSQDQSPAEIQHSWFFYCAFPLDHYPLHLFCKHPWGLAALFDLQVCGRREERRGEGWTKGGWWDIPLPMCGRLTSIGDLSNRKTPIGRRSQLPSVLHTRCLCPWKLTMSPTTGAGQSFCLFLETSGLHVHGTSHSALWEVTEGVNTANLSHLLLGKCCLLCRKQGERFPVMKKGF